MTRAQQAAVDAVAEALQDGADWPAALACGRRAALAALRRAAA